MNWPLLREELVVTDGPRNHDGQPSWTLLDPSRNRFFRLDWITFEILHRWSLRDAELIIRQIKDQTPLTITLNDIMAVLQFASNNMLLKQAGANTSAALAGMKQRAKPNVWQWLVHNYLFFRIPLIRPEPFLRWLHLRLQFIFRPTFWYITTLALLVGLTLLWRQWDVFKATWVDHSTLHGFLGYMVVLVGIKIAHEFGHGVAATHFGCRVPTMGIAFLVMTPVAYTDTNDAWTLRERRPRLIIGAAGIFTELAIAVWATLAWGLLPDGYARSVAFFVGTTTWIKSLLVNISPIMRFDGYYLLSDALDLPNLHTRAFALARWQLREWIFRLGETPPEFFRRSLRHGLVALAFFIWLYRLVVFVGIAVFVYHFFFKALGIVLFAIEIAWFVALPILSEVKAWFTRRMAIKRSKRLPWVVAVLLAFLAFIAVPLPQHIRVSGQMYPQHEYKIVAPEAAQLIQLVRHDGEKVKKGDLLLELESPLLTLRLNKVRAHEQSLIETITSASGNPAQQSRLGILQGELETTRAARREGEIAAAQLSSVAPFDGTFRLVDCDLHTGEAIAKQEQLATVIGAGRWNIAAYVDEQDSHLVAPGMNASFQPEGVAGTSLKLKVISVDKDATRQLSRPMLATIFGGTVQVRQDENELVPEHGVYRVILEAETLPEELGTQIRRGRLVIQANSESLIVRWSRTVGSVIWRELGF